MSNFWTLIVAILGIVLTIALFEYKQSQITPADPLKITQSD